MEKPLILAALAALAQETRLDTMRLLVREPAGLLAGQISDALDVRPNTMSANLTVLAHAGLVTSTREGRAIRYRANLDGLRAVIAYLLEDCCGGRPDQCAPLLSGILQQPQTHMEP